jgi:hypothetical protein
MARDSLFGERIIWTGHPEEVVAPPILRAAAALLFVTSAVSTLFAVVVALALSVSPASSLLFAAWSASLGLACVELPKWWLGKVRFVVTEHHVIYQRGPFRRTIERSSISFARIFWSRHRRDAGDLELVRAVPTGALRRRLLLRLPGVVAPDRVWAIVRGDEAISPRGDGARPLTQRLDQGERVVWAARRRPTLRAYVPETRRRWLELAMGAFLLAGFARMLWRAVPSVESVLAAGLPARSLAFAALVAAVALSALLVLAMGVYLFYDAVFRPGRLAKDTHYLITNKRVLIQRGHEELHLDRSRIVDVIDAPLGSGLSDVFLVLDGPRARALAASGAFGESERGPGLRPVFESLDDAESVDRILRAERQPPLSRAA